MKNLVSLLLAVCICLSVGVLLTACDEEHTHTLTKIDTVEASCETAGNSEYYICDCGKYFGDAEAKTEIEKDSWVLAATNHSYSDEWTYNETHHWKVATCEHTTEKSEYVAHTLLNNSCACGYVVTENTITKSEWENLLIGDYLSNVTFNEETVRYKDGEDEPYSTSRIVWKNTDSSIYKGYYEENVVSEEYYYTKQDNVWYSLTKKELMGIVLGWQGEAISNERAESQTFAGQIGTELVEVYSSFRYVSDDDRYLCETSDEGFIKIYIEEGKLVKVEMKNILTAVSGGEGTSDGTAVNNSQKIYEFVTYTFSDYGTTTIEVPEWTVATE